MGRLTEVFDVTTRAFILCLIGVTLTAGVAGVAVAGIGLFLKYPYISGALVLLAAGSLVFSIVAVVRRRAVHA